MQSPGEGEMQSEFKWGASGGVSLDSCLGSGHENAGNQGQDKLIEKLTVFLSLVMGSLQRNERYFPLPQVLVASRCLPA